MKRIIILPALILLLALSANAFGCVGKTLEIGASSSANDRLLGQLMAVMINERTGTTVTVEFFKDNQALFKAVEAKKINIFIENTGYALNRLGIEAGGDGKGDFGVVKKEYKTRYKLVLLKPFGTVDGAITAPVVPAAILVEFPALPRVIEKLKGIMADPRYVKALAAVESGGKPAQAARDLLKKKKLI